MRALLVAGVLLAVGLPLAADLPAEDLALPRQVSEGSWLEMRLEVLGLALSYPAYRVSVSLTDSNQVGFEFWISTPMAKHLSEAGRKETERVLAYHAEGIQKRVGDLLRSEFPVLWPRYDGRHDFVGEFLTPGAELDDPPERWALWREDALEWSWRP
ncbi:MAG TPA: hypothetical protein QGF95_09480 [Candidatus Latescibacteria bacterium]|jgi:hypothetical protein|nr:hypothetical protein [Candidatus Latescibacterota bacterium]HJP30771.1 hypothetical protein [Candidatus Latescibacterota bacterium]|tara:strand:- start:513 stop:983 length:471 start_codon:yes stop_codon:yes gene_type:complete